MQTTTRTPACTTKGCPAPRDPDWHVPICGHGLEGQHHHVVKRSQGGKDGPQVFLCVNCHKEIDEGEWGNKVQDIPGKGLVYWAWNLQGETLIERVLEEEDDTHSNLRELGDIPDRDVDAGGSPERQRKAQPTARPVRGRPSVEAGNAGASGEPVKGEEQARVAALASAPSASVGELPAREGTAAEVKSLRAGSDDAAAAPLSYDQWVESLKGIAMVGRLWRFDLGDKALEGERLWPHESSDALSKLGIHPRTLVNIMRVAERVPTSLRRAELTWTHHVLGAGLDAETQESYLSRAVEEELGVEAMREQLRQDGHLPRPEPKPKRWTLQELRECWANWQEEMLETQLAKTVFLDWLAERSEFK